MSRLSSFTGKNFENYSDGGINLAKTISFNDNLNVIFVPSTASVTGYVVNDFPVYFGFDRKVFTFTLIKNQPAFGASLPSFFIINAIGGSSRTFSHASDILWLDGNPPVAQDGVTQIINYILVNTASASPDGSSLTQYTVYGNLNGPYS
jgi:hypothetical protein